MPSAEFLVLYLLLESKPIFGVAVVFDLLYVDFPF